MNRREILDRIRQRRAEAMSLIEGVSAEKLDQVPGPKPDWSAKDMLAHLSYWEHPTLDKLLGRMAAASWGDVRATNAELLRQSRERSVPDVLREFFESGKRIIA
ncbi:MAG TPA: DinB family protein, partial [Acidobacteriota bacterium]|nr:DinB family protein [Acidobacteriota bacterium]